MLFRSAICEPLPLAAEFSHPLEVAYVLRQRSNAIIVLHLYKIEENSEYSIENIQDFEERLRYIAFPTPKPSDHVCF